jgi:hypothetical protein
VARRRDPRFEGERAHEEALLQELRALYAEADALYASWSCPASADCCHFARTGREPYVTPIELALVEKARARLSSGRRASGRRLPMVDRSCALLTAEGRCSIYAERPLGCRTYFCEDALAGDTVRPKDIHSIVARLRDIAAKHRPGGEAGRPFSRCIE